MKISIHSEHMIIKCNNIYKIIGATKWYMARLESVIRIKQGRNRYRLRYEDQQGFEAPT